MSHISNSAIAMFFLAHTGTAEAQSNVADYPKKALREGRQGKTSVTLAIGDDGRAQNCVVTGSSGSDDLDAETCNLLVKRGRWKPATDSNGAPVVSQYSTSITWKLP